MQETGKLILVKNTQNISDKFQKREFVIETQEQYPQKLLFELQGNLVDIVDDYNIGDLVTCSLNIRGRLWTSPQGEDKYFNTIICYKIQPFYNAGNSDDYKPPVTQTAPVEFKLANQPNSFADNYDDSDDIPF